MGSGEGKEEGGENDGEVRRVFSLAEVELSSSVQLYGFQFLTDIAQVMVVFLSLYDVDGIAVLTCSTIRKLCPYLQEQRGRWVLLPLQKQTGVFSSLCRQ